MHVVALHSLGEDKQSRAESLASCLGVTLYEAASRLRAPGNGPLVAAVFSNREDAERLASKLHSAGFKAVTLTDEEIESESHPVAVRRFVMDEGELRAESDNNVVTVGYRDVELILRGTGIVRSISTEIFKERSVSIGKALLSGGISFSKTTKTVRDVASEIRDGFVGLYARERPVCLFREDGLLYDSLGPELRPSRAANFAWLVSEFRRRCPHALYDERLLKKAAQTALLGPSLKPEEHLIVATALLAKVLRGLDRQPLL